MPRSIVATLLLTVLSGVGFAAEQPSMEDLKRQLEGTFSGSTTCGAKTGLELKLSKVEPTGQWLRLQGSLRVSNPRAPKGSEFEIGVLGQFDPSTQILLANWNIDVSNPNCVLTVGGRCVLEEAGVGFFKPMIERRRAELIKKGAFHLEAVRDSDGQGWQGTIRGASTDCPAMAIRKTPNAAAPDRTSVSFETTEFMLEQLRRDRIQYATDSAAAAYWLSQPAEAGDPIALARLGNLYETGGPGLPADPRRSFQYFQRAAEAGEARSQEALARMLASGNVVPKDLQTSEQWAVKARATRNEASRLCSTPEFVGAYYELIDKERAAPMNAVFGAVAQALTGIQVQPGTYAIVGAQSEAVGVLSRPFRCLTVSRRSGGRFTNVKSELEYAGEDENGTPLYRDQRADAAVNEAIASATTDLMNATPMIATFIIRPLGDSRYRITSRQDIRVSASDFSKDVDIRASAPADRPARVTSPMSTPAAQRPPAAAREPAPVGPGSADWDLPRAVRGIDRAFGTWASTWGVDRYIPGSAQIGAQQCTADSCEFRGGFSVARFGSRINIPFLA